ncbi:heavy metal-associated isoprenylated plant protein 39 [Canna indica]|uniref:Heavy metal-associated isoprenylated plant protein 39 n=1 Tax=Canna indica TaxID=4628 RepID=A0AAQ3KJF3_9LILI|nr:heavy metal-associated isoprenylated plant protein 39 [Canna indica]
MITSPAWLFMIREEESAVRLPTLIKAETLSRDTLVEPPLKPIRDDGIKKEEKKDEPKKEEKKEEAKKDEKKEEAKKEEKKKEPHEQMIADLVNAYKAYNPQMTTHYYVQSAEENPNSCSIM